MKICYIDAFSGLAGDMLVAALADAGADRDTISRALESFAIGAAIQWERVQRRGISAAQIPCRRHRTPEASPSQRNSENDPCRGSSRIG